MPCDTIQKCLQHALPTRDKCCVLLRFSLFDSVICHSILGWDGWDDDCWIEFDKIRAERFEFGVAMVGVGIL